MPLEYLHSDEYELSAAEKKVKVPVEDALSFAATRENDSPYSYELLKLIVDVQQDRGDRVSTTTLLNECDRNLILERLEGFAASPDDLWAAFKGTMFHSQLERVAAPGSIAEVRYAMTLPDGRELTCKPDIIDPVAGKLYDYKIVRELPKFNYPYTHHSEQLMLNRVIVDHAHSVQFRDDEDFLPVEDAEDRLGQPLRPGPADWTELVVYYIQPIDGPKPLTVTRGERVPKKNGNGTKSVRVPDLGNTEEIIKYAMERYGELERWFKVYPEEIPPIPDGWEGLTGWKCNYCPVRSRCFQLALEGR